MQEKFKFLLRPTFVRKGVVRALRAIEPSRLAMIVAGLVLLTAAVLKAHQLATEPVLATGILNSRWFLIGVVEFELFLGLLLVAGILPRLSWTAALACFGLFTGLSLYKVFSGDASCGCFGKVSVNPWYTLVLDLVIILSLIHWRPNDMRQSLAALTSFEVPAFHSRPVHALCALTVVWLLLGVPAAFAMGSYANTTLSDAGNIIGQSEIIILEPEKWIGKRFPLSEHIDIGQKLSHGSWKIVLYHHDCLQCQQLIAKCHVSPDRRIALIEMPPYSSTAVGDSHTPAGCVHGRVADSNEWFVTTPVEIEVVDGIVKAKVP